MDAGAREGRVGVYRSEGLQARPDCADFFFKFVQRRDVRILSRRYAPTGKFPCPVGGGMAEYPDQHDVVADLRHDHATGLTDVAVVNAERLIGKAHRVAREPSEARTGGPPATAH